jgi:uncharacterized protein (DUF58 family)
LTLWLVSANYHNNLAYLLTYLLTGMVLVAPFATRRQLVALSWRIEAPAPVFAGERAELALWLENPGPPRWQVEVTAPGAETVKLALDPGEHLVRLSYPAERRGLARIGPIRLNSSFPLGLFQAVCQLEAFWELWVYPRPADTTPLPAFTGRAGINGEPEFQGLRSYRPGDSPRQIHWKKRAKGQGLLTKEFLSGQRGDEQIFTLEELPAAELELQLAWLCRWLLEAERAGLCYGLKLKDQKLLPSRGDYHLHACLRALASFPGAPHA